MRQNEFNRQEGIVSTYRSNGGFSLLEMMITLGILAVVISGAMSTVSFFMHFMQTQKIQIDKLEVQKTVESAISSSCSCNFPTTVKYAGAGKDLDFTPPMSP